VWSLPAGYGYRVGARERGCGSAFAVVRRTFVIAHTVWVACGPTHGFRSQSWSPALCDRHGLVRSWGCLE
jgi:hypothetical protein